MVEITKHLVAQGCSSVAYICGASTRLHTQRRINALKSYAKEEVLNLKIAANTEFTEYADYIETERFLANGIAPQALIFENEVLALGACKPSTITTSPPGKICC